MCTSMWVLTLECQCALQRNLEMYFTHHFASKKLEKECLVSLVADLQHASLATVTFITEILLLLEVFDS